MPPGAWAGPDEIEGSGAPEEGCHPPLLYPPPLSQHLKDEICLFLILSGFENVLLELSQCSPL